MCLDGVTVTFWVTSFAVALAWSMDRSFGELISRMMPDNCTESALVLVMEKVLACAEVPQLSLSRFFER